MARARTAFDGCGMQTVQRELVSDFFQKAQLGFAQFAVGGGDIAGKRIGGFVQSFGEVIAYQAKKRVKSFFLLKKVENGLADRTHPVFIVSYEDRQQLYGGLNFHKLCRSDVFI